MNDPNGLLFHAGEYHLFFRHNPVLDIGAQAGRAIRARSLEVLRDAGVVEVFALDATLTLRV